MHRPEAHQDELAPPAVPRVRVAILSYNRRHELSTTLHHMKADANGYARDRLELVVVDNASTDGSPDMVRSDHPDVRLIESGGNYGAPALNLAIPGDYRWLLILDDDCYLEFGDLERAVLAAEAASASLVSFRVRSGVDRSTYFSDSYVTGMLSFWGCAVLVRREAVEPAGGYDPNIFIWGNELDLTLRLLDAGHRHLYLPDVVAVHMKAVTPRDAEFSVRGHNFNRRHWGYSAGRLLHPCDAVRVAVRMVLSMLIIAASRRDTAVLRGLPHLARGLALGARNRRPVRRAVSVAVRDNFESFANPLGFLRGPAERLGLTSSTTSAERQLRYRKRRPRFYPTDQSVLEL